MKEINLRDFVSVYSKYYADTLMSYMPAWMLPVLLIACFVSGIVGGYIGKSLVKKHFQRAGIN